jgi:hypothetical protein
VLSLSTKAVVAFYSDRANNSTAETFSNAGRAKL